MQEFEMKTDTGVILENNPAIPDGIKQAPRLFRYGEYGIMPVAQPKVSQAIETSYFTVNNGQTGLATAAAPTAFSATNPFLAIVNVDNVRSLIMDYAALIATAAGTAGTSLQAAISMDTVASRGLPTGGTELTSLIVNANGNSAKKSVARVFAGNNTVAAAGPNSRLLVGQRALKGAIPVAFDNYTLKFGSDDMLNLISAATLTWTSQPVPPVIVPPQWMLLLHIWLPAQSAASSYIPEAGWSERVC